MAKTIFEKKKLNFLSSRIKNGFFVTKYDLYQSFNFRIITNGWPICAIIYVIQ